MLLCLLLAPSGSWLLAQNVVLTRQTHGLDPDHVNNMKLSSYVEPGASGANQVWDLSGMEVEEEFQGSIYSAFEMDAGQNFPESNVVLNEGSSHFYFCQDDDALRGCGLASASGGMRMKFHRPYVKMVYPFAFGDAFDGEYEGTYFYSEDKQADIIGTYSVKADAYGRLILPGGHEVADVLRVVSTRSYDILNESLTTRNEIISYRWYARNERFPLVVLNSSFSSACGEGNTRYQGAYRLPTTQKQGPEPELSLSSDVKVYPNPVENHFTIDFFLHTDSDVRFELYDNTGKKIATLLNGPKKAGSHKEDVQLEKYSMYPGMYFVRSLIGDDRKSTPFVLTD